MDHKNYISNINMNSYLSDVKDMIKVINGVARHSNGILKGGIGALDGWLVRIIRPSLWRNFIKNPTSFFQERILCIEYSVYHCSPETSYTGIIFP